MGQTDHVRGEKTAMIAHLITCHNTLAAAKKAAKEEKGGKKEREDGSSSCSNSVYGQSVHLRQCGSM